MFTYMYICNSAVSLQFSLCKPWVRCSDASARLKWCCSQLLFLTNKRGRVYICIVIHAYVEGIFNSHFVQGQLKYFQGQANGIAKVDSGYIKWYTTGRLNCWLKDLYRCVKWYMKGISKLLQRYPKGVLDSRTVPINVHLNPY